MITLWVTFKHTVKCTVPEVCWQDGKKTLQEAALAWRWIVPPVLLPVDAFLASVPCFFSSPLFLELKCFVFWFWRSEVWYMPHQAKLKVWVRLHSVLDTLGRGHFLALSSFKGPPTFLGLSPSAIFKASILASPWPPSCHHILLLSFWLNACFGQGGPHPPDSLMPQGELTYSPGLGASLLSHPANSTPVPHQWSAQKLTCVCFLHLNVEKLQENVDGHLLCQEPGIVLGTEFSMNEFIFSIPLWQTLIDHLLYVRDSSESWGWEDI